jgi:hypothetical protein
MLKKGLLLTAIEDTGAGTGTGAGAAAPSATAGGPMGTGAQVWQERWFVLRDARLTCYATTPSSADGDVAVAAMAVLFVGMVKGAKRLEGLEVVDRTKALEYRHFLRVELAGGSSAGQSLILGAATEIDMLSWLTAFESNN